MSLAARPLHYVIKIGNRKANYDFFVTQLGMKILRHEEFQKGCEAECNGPFNGMWSKTMVGYGNEDEHFVIEMTYNYEIGGYKKGNDLVAIHVKSSEAYKKFAGGSRVEAGELVRLPSPDGYLFILSGDAPAGQPRISRVELNAKDLKTTRDYYSKILGMTVLSNNDQESVLSYGGQPSFELALRHLGAPIDRGSAYGRIAFSCPAHCLAPLESANLAAEQTVLTRLISLDTPGKATVQVVILADTDGHEICFVGDEAFRELSKVDPKADELIQDAISKDDSDDWFKNGKKTA